MKITHHALLVSLAVLLAPPALAQEEKAPEPIAGVAEALQEGEDGAEPEAEPTPAVKSFDCAVDIAGERCTVPLSEGDTVDGAVAYKAHTGKWVDFGWGPFNTEGQAHGCDWVLSFPDRLVEERGCFEAGKRHGPWETCRLRLDPNGGGVGPAPAKCPTTEYEMGVIVVKAKEPDPELAEEDADGDEAVAPQKGVKPETDKPSDS
ncbi:MAG: hypothetical protein P8R42_27595 [Candidatus Binatia bacterium]|nr:hypothetical protein [Candidatus Binatia bacterium]